MIYGFLVSVYKPHYIYIAPDLGFRLRTHSCQEDTRAGDREKPGTFSEGVTYHALH